MARPRLKYKIQRNGDSIKYYEEGEYIGSISIVKLGQFIKEQRSTNPSTQVTQKVARVESAAKEGYDPKTTYGPIGPPP